MTPVKFNLFWSVRLKIRPGGLALLDERTAPGAYQPDASGFITIKIWEFIRVFGPSVSRGRSPLFDDIIYLVPPHGHNETETIHVKF